MSSDADDILVDAVSSVRVVTLNRPDKLNVLSDSMVTRLSELWAEWDADKDVKCIVLNGAGERPCLCAGGDVKAVYDMRPPEVDPKRHKAPPLALEFFNREYQMNHQLANARTPHVAIMDGVVMGGGCGVSIHGAFRVATERTVLAMPECVIGLVPDVGATYFLSNLPGRVGHALALTGRRVGGYDAKKLGLATHAIGSSAVGKIVESLATAMERTFSGGETTSELDRNAKDWANKVDEALRKLEKETSGEVKETPNDLHPHLAVIDRWFVSDDVQEVDLTLNAAAVGGRRERERKVAKELLELMRAGCPASLRVTAAMLKRVRPPVDIMNVSGGPPPPLDLARCLRMEFRAVAECISRDDFYEGVKARLVDKGKGDPPAWSPESVEEVGHEDVETFFEPGSREVEEVIARFERAVGLEYDAGGAGAGSSRL
jgi:enoyl-CoA hydratase/carnithine racemase